MSLNYLWLNIKMLELTRSVTSGTAEFELNGVQLYYTFEIAEIVLKFLSASAH